MADYAYGHTHTADQLGISASSLGISLGSLGVQTGTANVTPTANEISSFKVYFPKSFKSAPSIVIVSPLTTVPYTTVRYVTAADYTVDGFTLYVYRTTGTLTVVKWMAVGDL